MKDNVHTASDKTYLFAYSNCDLIILHRNGEASLISKYFGGGFPLQRLVTAHVPFFMMFLLSDD